MVSSSPWPRRFEQSPHGLHRQERPSCLHLCLLLRTWPRAYRFRRTSHCKPQVDSGSNHALNIIAKGKIVPARGPTTFGMSALGGRSVRDWLRLTDYWCRLGSHFRVRGRDVCRDGQSKEEHAVSPSHCLVKAQAMATGSVVVASV